MARHFQAVKNIRLLPKFDTNAARWRGGYTFYPYQDHFLGEASPPKAERVIKYRYYLTYSKRVVTTRGSVGISAGPTSQITRFLTSGGNSNLALGFTGRRKTLRAITF